MPQQILKNGGIVIARRPTQQKSITYTTNGVYEITPDNGFDGLNKVTVSVQTSGSAALPEYQVSINQTNVRFQNSYLLSTIQENIQNQNTYNLSIMQENIQNQNTYSIIVSDPPEWTVNDVDGATYGFKLNSNNYYESLNKGVNSSYAICKVIFKLKTAQHLYFDCINYAESSYDFGLISTLNNMLSSSYETDTTNVFKSFQSESSASVVTVDYGDITTDECFVCLKFRKDSSAQAGNDSLQFKVRLE